MIKLNWKEIKYDDSSYKSYQVVDLSCGINIGQSYFVFYPDCESFDFAWVDVYGQFDFGDINIDDNSERPSHYAEIPEWNKPK